MSYTLNYTGSEIDDILDRAAPGGAIDQALAAKQDALTFDAVPTEGSTNPAESGGIYDAIQAGGAAALAAFPTDSVSGDVVSFTDGADGIPVKSFTGSILPIQDLHGYDNPWPAGGGVNKYSGPSTVNKGTTQYESVTIDPLAPAVYTISAKVSTTASGATKCRIALREADGTAITAVTIPVGTARTSVTVDTTSYGKSVGRLYFYSTQDTSDTNTAVFADIQIESGSTATDYAPYSNICPISGWTGANVYRMGANLFNAATATKDKFVDANGVIGTSVGVWSLSDYIPVKAGQTYTTIGGTTPSGPCNCFYDENKNFLSSLPVATRTFTVPDGAYFVRLSFRLNATLATEGALCFGASAEWSAYQGSTILLNFGTTVYAGTLTALGGGLWKIQPTHAMLASPETLAYTKYTAWGSDHTYSFAVSGIAATGTIYCNKYGQGAQSDIFGGTAAGWYFRSDISAMYISDPSYTTAAAFKASMADTQILYPLATLPDPIIVSAEDLQTLLGSNTVWTDVGSVTGLTYRADTALYIQKLIGGGGTLQTLSMASPSPSLSLGRVGVLAEPEEAEPEQTEEEAEQLEQTEEPEQTEEA